MVNFQGGFGERMLKRLEEEQVIWLTTVDASSNPQPRPVWFEWDGETLMIFSRANGAKLRHIQRNPKVALNFNTDAEGGSVGVIIGEAEIGNSLPPERWDDYKRKYAEGIRDLGYTPEEMAGEYPAVIFVRPGSIRGF